MSKMRDGLSCVLCAVVFAMLTVCMSPVSAATADYEKELTQARSEMAAYKIAVLKTPEIEALAKEMKSLDEAAAIKDKEFRAMVDNKLNKDPKYIELMARSKEASEVNALISKYRTEAENDPQAAKLKKESDALRSKAKALEAEAKKLVDAKFNSNEKVRSLLAKKAELAKAASEGAKYKNAVMGDVQIQQLQKALKIAKDAAMAKRSELRKISENLLKNDEKMVKLEAKIKELNDKAMEMRKATDAARKQAAPKPPAAQKSQKDERGAQATAQAGGGMSDGSGEGATQPMESGPSAGQASEGVSDRSKGDRSENEVSDLVAQYDKYKKDIEVVGKRLNSVLSELPQDSKLFQKTKGSLVKIGLPNINPEMFR